MNKPITSREYKLMLNADRFENLEPGVKEFWGKVMALAEKQGGTIPVRIKMKYWSGKRSILTHRVSTFASITSLFCA
jgi:hypothetical protein